MNRAPAHFASAYALLRIAADAADHWIQTDADAQAKAATDAAPVTYKAPDGSVHVFRTREGRRACARHCLTYTATQGAALIIGARVLDVRLHPAAVAAALAVSGITHYAADRRVPNGILQRLARRAGKERFFLLADHGMNGSYCLDQSWHHSWEGLAALIAITGAEDR
ncbi:hypothetical protein [Streptomyces yaizuensis]|uniref:Transcriptional regulator n=1 Tax=Streptomyces yaizuensis TaxID=2989713 RepID=A0AA86IVK5_9ACTN|nr:hypothetical protein [Streptomyces sp. YSPA8]BDT39674.1 transcriptional regulator [Streptomyces sp. YSPA8]